MSSDNKLTMLWHSVAPWVPCYTPDTDVLTKDGWKPITAITKEDYILTYNNDTKYMEYNNPTDIIVRDYNGKIINVKSKYVDLNVTPNHKMFVGKRQRTNLFEWKLVEAKDVINKQYKIMKTGAFNGEEIETVKIGNKDVDITDYLEFMGYYLSEGYVDHNPVNGNYTVTICQNEPYIDKMANALDKVTDNTVFIVDERKAMVRDKALWEYLVEFGYAHEKYIPNNIKQLNPRLLNIFIKAYELGDGLKNSHTRRIFTSSVKMRDDLQEIIIKAGYASDYYIHADVGEVGKFGESKYINWMVSINNRSKQATTHKGSKNDTIIDYNGKVYCVTVPNHILMVRRNGKSLFCGNSGYGRVSNHILSRLAKHNIKIIESCYYGLETGGQLNYAGFYCLPSKEGNFGIKSAIEHAKRFKVDMGWLFTDWWAFCFSEDTEILTKEGWKHCCDIKDDEVVATYNMKTSTIEYQKINKKFVFDDVNRVYNVKTKQLDAMVSGNHNFIYKTMNGIKNGSDWKLSPIRDISNTTMRYIPVSGSFNVDKELNLSNEMAWLLGFIIADSNFRNYDTMVYQSVVNDGKINKLKSTLNDLGFTYKEYLCENDKEIYEYKTSPYYQFRIHAEWTKEIMKYFADTELKLLSNDVIYNMNDEQYNSFISGVVDGDGWVEKSGAKQIVTKSETFRDILQIMAILHNQRCTYYKRKHNDTYQLTLTNKNYLTFKGKINSNEVSYSGKVWCVNTDNGTVIARRNGKHFITGNSEFPKEIPNACLYGPMDHENYPEEIINFTKMYWKIVSLCDFQKNMMKTQMGIDSVVIPHGVEVNLYKPLDKLQVKTNNGLKDKFVFGTVNANCFDTDTEILTKEGWKKYNELTENDEYLTLDADGVMRYYKADSVMIRNYKGKMYKLKTKYFDMLVTPEHKLYVKHLMRFPKYSDFEQRMATDVFGKRVMHKKDGGIWEGIEHTDFNIPEYHNEYLGGKKLTQHRIKHIDSRTVNMDDFLRFVGYYISEGHCKDWQIDIRQYDYIDEMESNLKRLPFKINRYNGRLVIYDVGLRDWVVNNIGNDSQNKHIPLEFMNLSNRQLSILLEAIALGDGWETSSSFAIGTSSKQLSGQLQEIAIKLGFSADVSEKIEHSKKRGSYSFYTIHFNTTIKEVQTRASTLKSKSNKNYIEEWIDYDGIIWDIVSEHSVVMVRRNGKSNWTCRSDKEMGGGRKSWGVMFKAMRYFLDENPDVRKDDIIWLCHTDPTDPRGLPLISMMHKNGLDGIVKFSSPEMHRIGLSDAQMVELYNSMDVFIGTSKREGFGMCVDENTLIETISGVKPIKCIEAGDFVLTSSGKFEKVVAKKDRKTDGYIVKPMGLPEVITSKEHKYYINRNGLFMWANAEELELSDYLVCPIPVFNKQLQNKIDIVDIFPSLEHDDNYVWSKHSFETTNGYYAQMKSLGYNKRTAETILKYLRNTSLIPARKRIKRILSDVTGKIEMPINKKYNRYVELTDSMLELFGWYIAKGSISNAMELSMGAKDKSLFNCMDTLHTLGNVTELSKDDSWRVCLSGICKGIFRDFGTSSKTKHIPNWIYGTNKCNPLIRGMLLGDGHSSNGTIIYTTKSEILAYQLRQILLSNKINSSIRIDKRTSCYIVSVYGENAILLSNILNLGGWFKECKNINRQKTNKTKIIDNYILLPIRSITYDEYDRQMYDIQVENDETFVGNGVLLHNTFIEAQACGVPCIGHDFSSLTELIKGHGWLAKSSSERLLEYLKKDKVVKPTVKDYNTETTPILAETAIPDVYSVADCIKDAYFKDKKREMYGKNARTFALDYDWDKLIETKWIPYLDEIVEELKPKKAEDRRID
jgi:intein/homing endonuclease